MTRKSDDKNPALFTLYAGGMVTATGHKESKPMWSGRGIWHWVLLALRQVKRVLLANGAAAGERGRSRWSIFLTVTSPGSKRKEETSFCPQIYKQIQKINNILTQYKCKYCSLVSITNTACLHIENGNSSSFTDGTYGSALVKMLG